MYQLKVLQKKKKELKAWHFVWMILDVCKCYFTASMDQVWNIDGTLNSHWLWGLEEYNKRNYIDA